METARQIDPSIGLKFKKRGRPKSVDSYRHMEKGGKKNTYLGPDANLPVPSTIPPAIKKLKIENKEKALRLIDGSIEKAIQVLINGLDDADKYYRFNCACTLLKKVLPDKKSGKDSDDEERGKSNQQTDKRTLVFNVINLLDEIGFEELRQRTQDGSFRLLETHARRERKEKDEISGEETIDNVGERPGQDSGATEGDQGSLSIEDGQGDGEDSF